MSHPKQRLQEMVPVVTRLSLHGGTFLLQRRQSTAADLNLQLIHSEVHFRFYLPMLTVTREEPRVTPLTPSPRPAVNWMYDVIKCPGLQWFIPAGPYLIAVLSRATDTTRCAQLMKHSHTRTIRKHFARWFLFRLWEIILRSAFRKDSLGLFLQWFRRNIIALQRWAQSAQKF